MDPFQNVNPIHDGSCNESTNEGARLILPGESGEHVVQVQKKLVELGVLSAASGVFDAKTETAVREFQVRNGVDADGKVGLETQMALLNCAIRPKIVELSKPPSEDENFRVFGDFRIVGWWIANLVFCDLSEWDTAFDHVEGLKRRADGRFGFDCHRLVAKHFRSAFNNIAQCSLQDRLVQFDGCFKVRYKRTRDGGNGDRDWSNHCWGIAIDINTSFSPLGRPLGGHPKQVGTELAACFENAGFFWGARYKEDVIDSQHFQFCTPSEDEK